MKMECSLSCVLLLLCGLWSSVCQAQLIGYVASDITLQARFNGDPSEINWKKGGNKVVDMELKPLDIHYYPIQGRATISPTDGSLTIRNLTVGDSGYYMAEALVDNMIQETPYDLSVQENVSSSSVPTFTETSTDVGGSVRSSTDHMDIHTSTVVGDSVRSSTNHMEIHTTTSTKSPAKSLSSSRTTPTPTPTPTPEIPEAQKLSGFALFSVYAGVLAGCGLGFGGVCYCVEKRKKKQQKKKQQNFTVLENIEETKAINHVKADEENATLITPGPESCNDKPEEEKAVLDTPEKEEAKPDNNVNPEEEKATLAAPGTEVGNNVQSKDEISALELQGTG